MYRDIHWGAVYGATASLALWVLIAAFLLSFGIDQRALSGIAVGTGFWVGAWIIGGVWIALSNAVTVKLDLVGLLYAVPVGAIMGAILVAWPYCSQPSDPNPQFLVYSTGLPVILFHNLLFGLLGLALVKILGLVSSVMMWGLVGVVVAELIRRRRRRNMEPTGHHI